MGSVPTPQPPRFLVIGAGSRGEAYGRAVTASTEGIIAAVAEIDSSKRERYGRKYIWGAGGQPSDGQSFSHWQDFIKWETGRRQGAITSDLKISGVFVCTMDETHAEIIQALAPLDLHILCEKPLALSLGDCLTISSALSTNTQKIISIGHVLRYSPHNMILRDLLVTQQVIGEIVSIEHTEPVGWWHFSHSYVRGNWRRSHEDGVGSLLTKSCHDIDFILWLLCSPSALTGDEPHAPATITSHGSLTQFRKARKPPKAANATNCLSCPAEPECMYSAKKIYVEKQLQQQKETGWPVKIVVPEIEDIVHTSGWDAAETRLMEKLGEDYDKGTVADEQVAGRSWYGRCVYESDNNVVDDQSVIMSWDDENVHGRGPKQAIFHMTYPTKAQCERRGRIYGSTGEIEYDSRTIIHHSFVYGTTKVHEIPKQAPEVEKSHGGGDWGLAGAFVKAVQAVDGGDMSIQEAQRKFVGCDLEEIIRSHAIVFAAEEARIERKVVSWPEWWKQRGNGVR